MIHVIYFELLLNQEQVYIYLCIYIYSRIFAPSNIYIYIANTSNGKWAPLSLALNQIAWPLKPVHSVSEFSAIDGAMPSVMLSNIGQFTWAMVAMHFLIHIRINNGDFTFKFSDFVEMFGVAGLVMLGVFETTPHNKDVSLFHAIGACMGFGTVLDILYTI